MTLLDDPPEPDALERIVRLRRRARDLALASLLLAAFGATVVATGNGKVGVAALVAAAAGVGLAGLVRSERRHELSRLVAAERTASEEVRAFAAQLVSSARRRRLAEGLKRAAAAGRPGLQEFTHVRPDRAHALHDELLELAAAFADPARKVRPASAALCLRLLSEPVASPLYNPQLPEEELERTLRAIRAGID